MVNVFILEDDITRIIGFEEAIPGDGSVQITVCKWLEGVGGALNRFSPSAPYNLILLDHDLGGQQMVSSEGEETGAAFARYLAEFHKPVEGEEQPTVLIHSYNFEGAVEMQKTLEEAGYTKVLRVPYGVALLRFLRTLGK